VTDETARIRDAQHGSQEAFTDLVEAYQAHVYNMCYRMLGDPEAAEDAAQETFLRAYQHLHRYDHSRSFATWLLSIAAHYCIDRLRRNKFTFTSMDEEEERTGLELADNGGADPEAETLQSEQREEIQRALGQLDSVDRAAVVLRYWHECSEAEIAETLHLTVSAVKSRLHRSRRALANHWEAGSPHPKQERRPHESPAF
jgi:RNA polymerase sigma-70 factor (ECF subfamily)